MPVSQSLKSSLTLTSESIPGATILVQLFVEFVEVKFEGPSKELFGKTVGLLGDFETGKTLARDGKTVMDDFTEFGDEWQVLPFRAKTLPGLGWIVVAGEGVNVALLNRLMFR